MIQLDIGGGESPKKGHINIDAQLIDKVDVVCDLRVVLPFKHKSIDVIWCSMVLEHLEQNKMMGKDYGHRLLHECFRILKPGGTVDVIVPDFGSIAEAYANSWNDKEEIRACLCGAQYNKYQVHYTLWTEDWLRDAFEGATFKNIEKIPYIHQQHQKRMPHVLQMRAIK